MNATARHVFVVPTHRPIAERALLRQFLEVERASRNFDVDMPLAYVDEGASNRSALSAMARRFPDVKAHYFTGDEVRHIYAGLARGLGAEAAMAFQHVAPDGHVNYGNTFNKLYLVAAVLGATRLHRRDSDTYAQELDPVRLLFPIDVELEFLGRGEGLERPLVVGGGYTGKWSIDIDHLIDDSDSTDLRRFFRALSIPEHEHDVVIHEHIRGNAAPYRGDQVELGSHKEPDCGNLAMAEIFDQVPCSPVRYALGGDYFTFSAAIEAGFARAYHNRSVVHAYTPCRYDSTDKIFGYWRATAALVVYQHFYRCYWPSLRVAAAARPLASVEELPALVLETLSDYRRDYFARPSDLNGRMQDFYEVIAKKGEPLLRQALLQIRERQAEVVQLVHGSIEPHLQLLASWPEIMAAAREYGASAAAKSLIAATRVA